MEVKDVAKRQGMSATAFPEEACARVRTSQTRGATNRNRVRRAKGGTSLQHKTKSSIHHIPAARRPGARASKAAGFAASLRSLSPVARCLTSFGFPREARRVSRSGLSQPQGRPIARRESAEAAVGGETSRRAHAPLAKSPEVSPVPKGRTVPSRRGWVNESDQ